MQKHFKGAMPDLKQKMLNNPEKWREIQSFFNKLQK